MQAMQLRKNLEKNLEKKIVTVLYVPILFVCHCITLAPAIVAKEAKLKELACINLLN
jgi:hypothetical protein